MKRMLLCLVVTFCAVSFAHADRTIRSLQQTLKNQGFYYGAVTGKNSTETAAAIRRYQIRNGLQVTGELNDETLRSVKSSSNAVAAESRPDSKSAVSQPSSGGPDVNARVSQSSPAPSFNEPNRPLEINQSYVGSFYKSAPIRVNRRIIAEAQYRLMSRGYYLERVDGNYGRQTAFAVRAFQSSAGLTPTGRLDTETLEALGSADADFAYSAPPSGGYETWMPVRKFKHGKWKLKWKRYHRAFGSDDDEENRRVDRQPGWNPYNEDY